jgi:hypothetical protein
VNKGVIWSTLLAVVLASAAPGADRGFDGKWVLDKNMSNSATTPPPDGLQQRIKTSGNRIVIESVFKEPPSAIAPLLYLGVMTTTMQLGLDGSETVNQIGPFMQTSKTTMDGNKMDTEWVARHTSGEVVNGHWTRTFANDGKHMTLEIKESSTQGQSGTATLNFVKK